MKNVLFVGPYRQTDGWGNASREYLRALIRTGMNVSARPIYLNNTQKNYPEYPEFEIFEDNRSSHYDAIIQHCLPHQFRYYGDAKNIGISFFETGNLGATPWVNYINTMDEMWVTSKWEKSILEAGKVKIPVSVIRIPTNHEKYNRTYPKLLMPNHDGEFKFYFIGEYITRKDLNSLLIAFHREFHVDEKVRLVIKVNKSGVEPFDLLNKINSDIQNLKTTLKLYPKPSYYKKEIIIPTHLPEDELYGLHQSCDCFVMPSRGEAFCLPAFDALMFGKFPVVNRNSSTAEYLESFTGYGVESYQVPAIAVDRPLPFLYTGRDTWYQIDILDLQRALRYAFVSCDKAEQQKIASTVHTSILPHFTYSSVAQSILDHL